MTLLMQPDILFHSEATGTQAQSAFSTAAANIQTRYLENKPALLVVTDALGKILLSIVGTTAWYTNTSELAGPDYEIDLTFRSNIGATEASFTKLGAAQPIRPRIPALRFTPNSMYTELIRNSGTATRAFLIVDTLELYSKTSTSNWPVGYWDGSVPLDVATLPTSLPYLELSVGLLNSGASLRLTRTELDKSEGTVQMADPMVYIYMTNLLNDWSTAKADLIALLTSIPEIGTSMADILAKEAAAYPA